MHCKIIKKYWDFKLIIYEECFYYYTTMAAGVSNFGELWTLAFYISYWVFAIMSINHRY